MLRARRPDLDVRLRIVGDGPTGAAEPAGRSTGYAGFVTGPAPARPREVAAALLEADLALVPSRVMWDGSQEAFCRVAIEAMSTGLPVVATRSGGLPDTVGEGGVVAAREDAAALADAAEALLSAMGPADWAVRATMSAARFESPACTMATRAYGRVARPRPVDRAPDGVLPHQRHVVFRQEYHHRIIAVVETPYSAQHADARAKDRRQQCVHPLHTRATAPGISNGT